MGLVHAQVFNDYESQSKNPEFVCIRHDGNVTVPGVAVAPRRHILFFSAEAVNCACGAAAGADRNRLGRSERGLDALHAIRTSGCLDTSAGRARANGLQRASA